MPPVLAAAAVTAVASAGSAVYGANQAKKASKRANAAQQAAADKQLAAQQAALDRITNLNTPFINGGQQAYAALLQQFGIGPAGSTGAPRAPAPALSYDRSGNTIAAPSASGSPVAAAKANGGPAGTLPNEPAAPATAAPAARGPDYAAYLTANPDVGAEFTRLQSTPEGQAQLQSIGATNPTQFAQYHANTFAQSEGRNIPTAADPNVAQPLPGFNEPDPNAPPDLINAARPNAAAAPTFQRPEDLAIGGYGSAPNLDSFFSNFEEDPGAAYRRSEALNGVNAFSAARGKLRSGDAVKALGTMASNLGSQEYNNWFNRQMSKYQQSRGAFESDRGYQTGQRNFDQGRQDANFGNDRAFDMAQHQYGVQRGDQNFNADRQFQAGRQDTSVGNLFDLANTGLRAAGNVSGAVTGNANAQTGIYGSQANAASDAAYARANANAGMVGNLAGTASNLFAAWGGGGGSGSGGTTLGQAWNSSMGGGFQPSPGNVSFVNTPANIRF